VANSAYAEDANCSACSYARHRWSRACPERCSATREPRLRITHNCREERCRGADTIVRGEIASGEASDSHRGTQTTPTATVGPPAVESLLPLAGVPPAPAMPAFVLSQLAQYFEMVLNESASSFNYSIRDATGPVCRLRPLRSSFS